MREVLQVCREQVCWSWLSRLLLGCQQRKHCSSASVLDRFSVEPAARMQLAVQSEASSLGALQVWGSLGALEQEKGRNAPIATQS